MLERGSESESGGKVGARKPAKAKGKSEEQQGLKSAGRTAGAGKRKKPPEASAVARVVFAKASHKGRRQW